MQMEKEKEKFVCEEHHQPIFYITKDDPQIALCNQCTEARHRLQNFPDYLNNIDRQKQKALHLLNNNIETITKTIDQIQTHEFSQRNQIDKAQGVIKFHLEQLKNEKSKLIDNSSNDFYGLQQFKEGIQRLDKYFLTAQSTIKIELEFLKNYSQLHSDCWEIWKQIKFINPEKLQNQSTHQQLLPYQNQKYQTILLYKEDNPFDSMLFVDRSLFQGFQKVIKVFQYHNEELLLINFLEGHQGNINILNYVIENNLLLSCCVYQVLGWTRQINTKWVKHFTVDRKILAIPNQIIINSQPILLRSQRRLYLMRYDGNNLKYSSITDEISNLGSASISTDNKYLICTSLKKIKILVKDKNWKEYQNELSCLKEVSNVQFLKTDLFAALIPQGSYLNFYQLNANNNQFQLHFQLEIQETYQFQFKLFFAKDILINQNGPYLNFIKFNQDQKFYIQKTQVLYQENENQRREFGHFQVVYNNQEEKIIIIEYQSDQ